RGKRVGQACALAVSLMREGATTEPAESPIRCRRLIMTVPSCHGQGHGAWRRGANADDAWAINLRSHSVPVMPASLIPGPHLSISLLRNAASSAGVEAIAATPS